MCNDDTKAVGFEFDYDDESDVLEATADGITGDNDTKSSCVHKEVLPCFSRVSGMTMMMMPLLMVILMINDHDYDCLNDDNDVHEYNHGITATVCQQEKRKQNKKVLGGLGV